MALSRLKLLEAEVGRQTKCCGRRWLSSSSKDSKGEKLEAVKSFFQRYIRKFRVLPGAKEVKDEVGDSSQILGNSLTDLKTKMLPESEVVKNIASVKLEMVAETNLDNAALGGYKNGDKLDQDKKALAFATQMVDVEESMDLDTASIGGNRDNNNMSDGMIGVEELTNLDSASTGRNRSSDKLDQDCKTSALQTEMVDAEESLQFSGNTELSTIIRREQSLSSHKPSETTLRQHLPDTVSHIGKDKDNSGKYDANIHLDTTISNEDNLYKDKGHGMQSEDPALNMDPQKTNLSIVRSLDMSNAEHNVKSSHNVYNLVEFFKRNSKKEHDLGLANSENLKDDTALCQPNDNKCFGESVDRFKQNQRIPENGFTMSKKNLLQNPSSNLKLCCQDPESITKAKSIFHNVFKLLDETSKTEPSASQPYMKNDNGQQECSRLLHAHREPLCSNVKSENKLSNFNTRGEDSRITGVCNSLPLNNRRALPFATQMVDVEEPMDLDNASIGGNRYNNNMSDEMIGVEKLTNLDSASTGRHRSSDKLDQDSKTSALQTEMVDAEESLQFSGNTELSTIIRREQSLSSHKPSETTLRQHLPDTISHIGKDKDYSGNYDANIHLDTTISNEDNLYKDKGHGMQSEDPALDMDPQKINLSIVRSLDMSTAEHNVKSSHNVYNLVEFFKSNTKKEHDLGLANSENLKDDTALCQPNDNKCFGEFVDKFKQNQRKPENGLTMSKMNVLQNPSSNLKLCCQDPESITKVKSIFHNVFKLLSETSKTEPSASQPYMKNDNGQQESSRFLHAHREPLCSNVKSENKLSNFNTREEESRITGVCNSLPLNNRRENGGISCNSGKRYSLFNQNVKAIEPMGSKFISKGDSGVSSFCHPRRETSNKDPFVARGLNLKESGKLENHLVVKFLLKTATVDDIYLSFHDCGPIAKVCILPTKRESRYNHAYVAFETGDGLRQALSKTDVSVCGADVSLQPASPIVLDDRFVDMQPVKDAIFPAAFLRDPTRTILIKGLLVNLSFQQLETKFASFGPVSGIAMGPLGSSIYVEFESEESKERALAVPTISLLGRHLSIYRVDAPKTTILRISRVNPLSGIDKIQKKCESYGQVKRVVQRDGDTFDVHFKLSEQTNMLVILNSLNGSVVDRHQWLVQPATVIPPEILQTLWKTAEGRRYIRNVFHVLCKAIQEKSIDTNSIRHLGRDYFSIND